MNCPSCGEELAASHRFCPSCGAPVSSVSQAPTAAANSPFALYAFHTSLGGQPMFGRTSLED